MTHRPSQRLSRRMTHGASVHTKGFKVAKGRKAISPLNHRIRLKGGVEAHERHERHFVAGLCMRKECTLCAFPRVVEAKESRAKSSRKGGTKYQWPAVQGVEGGQLGKGAKGRVSNKRYWKGVLER